MELPNGSVCPARGHEKNSLEPMVKIETTETQEEFLKKTRSLGDFPSIVVSIIAIGMSCFQLYFSLFTVPSSIFFRSTHLMFAMVLIFFLYPSFRSSERTKIAALVDVLLSILALVVGTYIIYLYKQLIWKGLGDPHLIEVIFGIVAICLVLEITRRAVGYPLTIIGVLFILYDLFGKYSPIFPHTGFSIKRTVSQLYLTVEGIYGMPLGVMTSFVFLFILFSAFLQKTGAGEFLINLSFALMGRFTAGPAKAAAVASGFFGSISGSILANVMGTGTFTIPMMKRLGYEPHVAGAVEVASSTGGQLMPPIMGAGVFIMAEWTGIPYIKIIGIALVPAILYYVSVIAFIHFNAVKTGIGRVAKSEIPSIRETLRKGWQFFIPVVVVIYILIKGYTPMRAAIGGIFSVVLVHLFNGLIRKESKERIKEFLLKFIKDIISSLDVGARNAVVVSAALTCAGIIVGSVGLTGMGLRISNAIISITAGNLFFTIIFVGLASLIMGMEMPITASYIVVAILAVPALKSLGLPLLVAHLIVFWYSQDAAITPPVCISAYAAAAIAKSNPFKTGIAAWKIAKGLYVMPILFAYTNLITGTVMEILKIGFMTTTAFVCIAACWEGHFIKKTNLLERVILGVAGIMCLVPNNATYAFGFFLFGVVIILQIPERLRSVRYKKIHY